MPRQPQISVLRNPGLFFGKPLYALETDWTFEVVGYGQFTIPRGYQFDGASVPRAFWGLLGYMPFGLHIAAAIEHDFLCDLGLKPKSFVDWMAARKLPIPAPVPYAVAHAHFHFRLQQDGLRPSQAWTMGHTVRWFGPRWKT